MAATQTLSGAAPESAAPTSYPVRTITRADLDAALREGYRDFMDKRGDLLFAGLIYPMIGLLAAGLALGGDLIHLFFPVAAGISLLGPVAATGFYELARRREQNDDARWTHFLDVVKRPSFDSLAVVVAILFLIFGAWVASAALLYGVLIGPEVASLGELMRVLFTTVEGWTLIIAGNALGALFAVLVLSISVVSMPMLVDADVDARTAMVTSIAAVRANAGLMLRWGITVGMLLVLGSIPFFVGLAFVLPWLGYATWHLYTRLVDRSVLVRPTA